jgi:hypothetical protein
MCFRVIVMVTATNASSEPFSHKYMVPCRNCSELFTIPWQRIDENFNGVAIAQPFKDIEQVSLSLDVQGKM